MAVDVGRAWGRLGGVGAMLTNLDYVLEPSVIQNVETAQRFEKAQSAARTRLDRRRGNFRTIREEPAGMNGGGLKQCVADQLSEFTDRAKPETAGDVLRRSNPWNPPRRRSRTRQRYGCYQGTQRKRAAGRAESPQAHNKYQKEYPPPKTVARGEESDNKK